jgi:hypothetical protein
LEATGCAHGRSLFFHHPGELSKSTKNELNKPIIRIPEVRPEYDEDGRFFALPVLSRKGYDMTARNALIAATVLVLLGTGFYLWVADRPSDVPPPLHQGAGPFLFDPKHGPKTTQQVEDYVQNRATRSWGRTMTPADRKSPSGQAAWADAVHTLQRRWGLRPGMTQDEIDTARAHQQKLWEEVERQRTFRYKVRTRLGME